MARRFERNVNVAKWLTAIQHKREDLGLTASKYGDATMLALIHVESSGDPYAHRDGSAFWGLLQMADPYVADACDHYGVPRVKARTLHGDGEAAIELAYQYFERYRHRHDYVPSRIAALHKGGAGSARTITERLQAGDTMREACSYAEQHHGVPNIVAYVDEFRAALTVWSEWCEDQEAAQMCAELRGKVTVGDV